METTISIIISVLATISLIMTLRLYLMYRTIKKTNSRKEEDYKRFLKNAAPLIAII
ncbi:MAG: hypothetical protein GX895_08125 [Clostridiales bacterium]|nr:hypothetical protein [Clostridiales bacterium]